MREVSVGGQTKVGMLDSKDETRVEKGVSVGHLRMQEGEGTTGSKQSITAEAADCMRKTESDSEEKDCAEPNRLTTFLRCGPAVAGLSIRVHNFTSSGCVHLF